MDLFLHDCRENILFVLTTSLFSTLWLWNYSWCSVGQLCPTLCDPKDCSTLGFPVHHLLELAQTHVHWVGIILDPYWWSFRVLPDCCNEQSVILNTSGCIFSWILQKWNWGHMDAILLDSAHPPCEKVKAKVKSCSVTSDSLWHHGL